LGTHIPRAVIGPAQQGSYLRKLPPYSLQNRGLLEFSLLLIREFQRGPRNIARNVALPVS